jgi:N-acetyl-1-D-myo-inositol-2-amino-2-deoxy-alpha-D-glucopyranoside deacetylase
VADVPELGTLEEIRARLGEVRQDELVEACRRLGTVDLRMLGFHDSGMDGTPDNSDPKVFINQDVGDAVRKIVAVMRDVRPQVLVTYNEIGGYGHPDHVRAHAATLRAVDKAADPAYEPDDGAPHEVAKVYFTAFPRSLVRMARELWKELGGEDPDELFDEEEMERITTDDELITSAVDVSAYIDRKFAALEAHRTQLGTTGWILSIPDEYRILGFGTEHYVLARSTVPRRDEREADLFEGVVE